MATTNRARSVRPDSVDFRDLLFRPNVGIPPRPTWFPDIRLPVKNQRDTSACTGFALSLVVEHLLRKCGREPDADVSPYMLYSMARRYDEFAGNSDEGSSLRGALKGWHKHGACGNALWRTGLKIPPTPKKAVDDWWLDAVTRPLGAYYRIDRKQLADIHAALNEVGVVYASVDTHAGWDAGDKAKARAMPRSFKDRIFEIPADGGGGGGHAIALIGYNERGFLLQNSWGAEWGSHGYAILSYDDWLDNAMDCWVAQLGVVTSEHCDIAAHTTLRTNPRGRVALSSSEILRNREIAPFVVNMGNNGQLSDSGQFRTRPADLQDLVDVHLAEARKRWQLDRKPLDVCIYAHGGLVGENDAADNAAEWIPMLYDAHIFPVYLMWETGFMSTLCNRLSDALRDVPRPAGAGPGFWSRAERWWNERVERMFAKPGTQMWGEMKQNAHAISANKQSGAAQLYAAFARSAAARQPVRFHLVGHSAGSIVHAHIIDTLADRMKFESVSFLAPAVRRDTFEKLVLPRLADGAVRRYQQFHLTDKAEEDDPTCAPYKRSLLYLVSESFEGGRRTPILGMDKYFDHGLTKSKDVKVHVAPCAGSASTTHGGFDNDPPTRKQVIRFIKQ